VWFKDILKGGKQMKRLVISSLLCMVLLMNLPAIAFAKGKGKPADFEAQMTVLGIGEGDVTPVPPKANPEDIIRWIVRDRPVYGQISGDINGGFTIIYSGNVDTSQEGNIHGSIDIACMDGSIYGKLRGKSSPGVPMPQALTPEFLGQLLPEIAGYLLYLQSQGFTFLVLPIDFTGGFTFQGGTGAYEGVQGTGKFGGTMVNAIVAVSPVGESHVAGFAPSVIDLTGKWHQ